MQFVGEAEPRCASSDADDSHQAFRVDRLVMLRCIKATFIGDLMVMRHDIASGVRPKIQRTMLKDSFVFRAELLSIVYKILSNFYIS